MEIVLFAYQVVAGSDDLLWFSETELECQMMALSQRQELQEREDFELLGPMAVYRVTFRQMNTLELVRVLNGESIVDVAAIEKRLVAVVTD